jgi:uncharacterized phage protein (predicted DNA packaging)
MTADPVHQLWVRVILQATEDAAQIVESLASAETNNARNQRLAALVQRDKARLWFNPKNPDFVEVCNLAGMDPDAVAERAAKAIRRCDEAAAKGERFDLVPKPAQAAPRKRVTYTHDGKTMTLAEWAAATGISDSALRNRIYAGHDFANAISPDFKRRPRNVGAQFRSRSPLAGRKAKLHTIDGVSKSLSQWAKEFDVSYGSLVKRLAKGQALKHALSQRRTKSHEVEGISLTLAQWARALGITYNAFAKRVNVTGSVAAAVAMGGPMPRGLRRNFRASGGTEHRARDSEYRNSRMIVSLALLKSQLRIDHDLDDALLLHKIAAAEAWIEENIGKPLADFETLPASLVEAILQLAGAWYKQREAVSFDDSGSEVPFGVRDIIRSHREWEI